MIITLTLNPALDKTAAVPAVVPGTLHRLENLPAALRRGRAAAFCAQNLTGRG